LPSRAQNGGSGLFARERGQSCPKR
jgi:hypothetical protein